MLQLLCFDVDGVLTDGRLCYGPDGELSKVFSARDGIGFRMLGGAGVDAVLISGHDSPGLRQRAEVLGVSEVRAPEHDKVRALAQISSARQLKLVDVGMVGDDLQDLRAMRMAGWSACPCDAVAEVRAEADYVSPRRGGCGAARDIIEYVLRRSGRLAAVTAGYFPGG